MVKYRLIKKYPQCPLKLNDTISPENSYSGCKGTYDWIINNPELAKEYWQEVKELTLLEEAKLRYPTGTKFKSVQYDSGIKISNNNIYEETYIHLPIIYCDGTTIYYNNKWAEIIDDFVLPEKWCVKTTLSNRNILQDYLENNIINYPKYLKTWEVINDRYFHNKGHDFGGGHSSGKIFDGFIEITFEQFKKYVLKEEAAVKVEEKVVEKDYEILEIKGKYGAISTYIEELDNDLKDKTIFKVRRLSDGEIFTIGDKVFSEYVNYTINKIGIVNDKCMVSALYDTNNPNGSRLHYNLNNLKKAKQPLFTTEDGVDIFDYSKNHFYFVKKESFKLCENLKVINQNVTFKYEPEKELYFSTKGKAEEYILMNKPLLSLSDVWDNLKVKDQKEVMKFVKSKLNKNG